MSVVKINAIHVPDGMGPQLEQRFAGRAKMVEQFDGFEDFQLLRPVEGEQRYFVYTRWASEEHFQAWLESREFSQGHAQAAAEGDGITCSIDPTEQGMAKDSNRDLRSWGVTHTWRRCVRASSASWQKPLIEH